MKTAPGALTAEQLTALLRPLPPRYYSIASSRKAVGEEAHLLVAGLRYVSHGREREGVASVDITARHRESEEVLSIASLTSPARRERHVRGPAGAGPRSSARRLQRRLRDRSQQRMAMPLSGRLSNAEESLALLLGDD